MSEKYSGGQVEVVIVDVANLKDMTRKVMSEASIASPILLDDKDISRKQYKIVGTPTTLLIDPSGKVIFRHVGYGPGLEKTMDREVELLIRRKTT